MIKAVIFDYGGVVTDGGAGPEVIERLGENLNIGSEEALRLMRGPWDDFMRGAFDTDGFWQRIESAYGSGIPEESRDVWNTWEHMAPRPEMLALIKELKAGGLVVGLLSNVIPVTEQIIREQGGYELFQPCVLSCALGLKKPEREVYEELLRQLPDIEPEQILFVDDQERCLVPARAMGIQTLLAENTSQIVKDVEELVGNGKRS
jgi:putative hydrolase of the HAD superfamily